MNKLLYITFIASLLIIPKYSEAQNPEITTEELNEHIGYLASEKLKGRYPGTPGDEKAANYIREQFEQAGLHLLGEKGFQNFSLVTGNSVNDSNFIQLGNIKGKQFKEFTPFPFSGSDTILDKPVVFAGYGFEIENEELSWNDYKNIDATDSWVMILRGRPEIEGAQKYFMQQSSDRAKAIKAFDKGACGVIFVAPDKESNANNLVNPKIKKGNIEIPVIHFKQSFANTILKTSEGNIDELVSKIKQDKKPLSFDTEKMLSAQVAIQPKEVNTQNIVAEIDVNSDDYIIIGGHYDHLGEGGIGSGSRKPDTTATHYGADDNASGIAAMIEIAEQLSHNKENLESNIMFIAFGAEEKGLVGSKYFVMNPLISLDKVKAMINLDMIGRLNKDEELQVGGVGTSMDAEKILDSINRSYNYQMGYSHEGYGPSDHSSFYSKDIPVFFFSTGPHLDYHTPADVPEKINYAGITKISEYIVELIKHLNQNSTQLNFKKAGAKSEKEEINKRREMKVTLGIMPDFAGVEDRGLRADLVIEGETAEKGGMKKGDIITAINGNKIRDVYDYMEKLSTLEPGETITVEIIRNEEKKVLLIQL